MLKISPNVEVTRNKDGSISLVGYFDDVNQNKEKINEFVIKSLEGKSKALDEIINLPTNNTNVQWEYYKEAKCIFFQYIINY